MSLQSLETDVSQLEKYLHMAEVELKSVPGHPKITAFIEQYKTRVAETHADLRQAISVFKQVLKLRCEC